MIPCDIHCSASKHCGAARLYSEATWRISQRFGLTYPQLAEPLQPDSAPTQSTPSAAVLPLEGAGGSPQLRLVSADSNPNPVAAFFKGAA